MSASRPFAPRGLEMWGGVECSYARLEWGVCDQLARTGHAERDDDLEKIASLGVRTLRYPLLWERHAGAVIDWRWADRRLRRLRELGIRPIIGLLHHGCGPLPGGFADPGFVSGLTRFARAVASRYPWIDAYTPVNEPLTTARFSGLYGLWHPFQRDPAVFAENFLVQLEATRAAMGAIRQINPAAELIQTEDLGKTHATPHLQYQANWENERRWLTFDLLNGTLDPRGPLWGYLRDAGIAAERLQSFRDQPCRPDVFGMNHYVTGERLLDERVDRYPPEVQGGNDREIYVDLPAVRVRAEGLAGMGTLMRELWARYRAPFAVTEVQLACTREEQMRWLVEAWECAREVRATGADVRAITAWALLGAFDWDTLLLERRGRYESGAFELRGGRIRQTAVGWAVQRLAEAGELSHPVLATPGWWRRGSRLIFPPVSASPTGLVRPDEPDDFEPQPPILLIGASADVGTMFQELAFQRGLNLQQATYLGLSSFAAACRTLEKHQPWTVIVVQPGAHRRRRDTALPPRRLARLITRFAALCERRELPLELWPEVDESIPEDRMALAAAVHAVIDRAIDRSVGLETDERARSVGSLLSA